MSSLAYATRAFVRAGARNAAYVLGLALAVALVSATLFFIDGATRDLTQRAIAPVALDFQARAVDPTADVAALAPQLRGQPGVTAALPFAAATVAIGPEATAPGGEAPLPARLLAMSPDYPATFPLLTVSAGHFGADGALVSEQLATSLGLKLGETLVLTVPGLDRPYPVVITGLVNTDRADPLFAGPVAAPEGSYNVAAATVVLDYARFDRELAAPLARAAAAPVTSTTAAVAVVGLPVLDRQVHLRLDRARFPADPGAAATAVATLRRQLERQASGQLRITDNLATAFAGAREDVVAARLLFVFLGLPGVLLAAYLAHAAAGLVGEAQRRDVALLRARGLAPRRILAILGWAAALTALLGTALGLALGAATTAALFGTAAFRDGGNLARSALATGALGVALGGVGVFLPARRMLAGEIAEGRREVAAAARPAWTRLPLDLALLAGAALALWLSGTYNTRAATAGASETAAVSLGFYAFLGPLLFWLGAALLFLRLAGWTLARPAGRWRGRIAGLAGRSLRRRGARAAVTALLLALALSFGVAVATFGATYDASRRADARYTVGADLRVTPALTNPQPAAFADRLRVPGVRAVAPVWVANDALVGAQTQTVYGVDVDALAAATAIPDRFFPDGDARGALDRLAATPDGMLVSGERAVAFNIQVGDTVAMRLPRRGGGMADVRPRVVGIFAMFPTSSQNSDLVVNAPFLTAATGRPDPGFFLLGTDGRPATDAAVADALAAQFKDRLAARVETADRAIGQDRSSLVGLNLAGLVALDRLYAALLVGLGLGVFLWGGILERGRELGTLAALGATPGQVTGLLLLEGAALTVVGVGGGLLIGAPLAWQYNGFLPGIFAVPQPLLTLPWPALSALLALALLGVLAAAALAALRLRRLWPADALRDA
jgi:putative ABC transport system permease protein